MLFTALMVLLFILVIVLCYLVAQIYVDYLVNRHHDEMEAVKEETEEKMREWTLWIYDPERRYQERFKEIMDYRENLIREWKREGKSRTDYETDLKMLDGYINHFLDQYHAQLFDGMDEE